MGVGLRPRAAVLDEVWRTLDGVDALSAPHGGPLYHVVTDILDPLVLTAEYAGPLVDPAAAHTVAARLRAAGPRLAATAAWFTQCRPARRAARVTAGDSPRPYLAACFALAGAHGMPDPVRARTVADETVRTLAAAGPPAVRGLGDRPAPGAAVQLSVRAGTVTVTPADPAAHDIDAAVLPVHGGQLYWSIMDLAAPPVAVVDDARSAQGWVWIVYGEAAAVALAAGAGTASHVPGRPEMIDDAALLAYAEWARRWWPASRIDAIPALNGLLLAEDIAGLRAECDGLLADSLPAGVDYAPAVAVGGPDPAPPGGPELVLARGSGGTDWRACPPGLIDASEAAVSWALLRANGHTRLRIEVAPAPGLTGPVPAHLWPVVRAWAGGAVVRLQLEDGRWQAVLDAPDSYEPVVALCVPGYAGDSLGDPGAGLETRERVRRLVRARLRAAAAAEPGFLLAEIHAGADAFMPG